MRFIFTPMTAAQAHAIVAWHYEGPYAFYDVAQDPDDARAFLDNWTWGKTMFSVVDARGELAGFFSCRQDGDAVTIGLGLRPDLTGQGLGFAFLQAGLGFARGAFSPRHFRLSVALFNRRAIRVYERAGFRPSGTATVETNGGRHEFLDMTRPT